MKIELPETISSGETLAGVQLCPFGEFPNGKTVQLCDETAFNKIAANFAADGGREILCDFEHKSDLQPITASMRGRISVKCADTPQCVGAFP